MSLRLCLMLFVVPLVYAANSPNIDQQVLSDIFGGSNIGVVSPVTPENDGPLQTSAQQAPPQSSISLQQVSSNIPAFFEEEQIFVQSNLDYDAFDLTLTRHVAMSGSETNFLLSPMGLKLALSILFEAATGQTRNELGSVLGFENNVTSVRAKFSTILSSLNSQSSQYILNLGSRIYLEKYIQPQQRFAAIAKYNYMTELVTANFSNPIQASEEINAWVSNLTTGLVPGLVTPDEVDNVVVMVLTVLYFKGTWYHQFSENNTKMAPFYVTPKTLKSCRFMNLQNKFYYAESLAYDAKILRLPYLGNKFSMYLIVPNSLTGLSSVLNSISANGLREEILRLEERTVDVTMPKFTFDYTSVLDNLLQELGIRLAFEDIASFPGISRGQQLLSHRIKISKVLQRSGIEVNENGTVAYSATEILLENKFGGVNDPVVEIKVDRPFLFFIQDEATRQLLFTGRVADPLVLDGALKKD